MVETWDVARCQRDLRELATTRPREAMSLVRSFVDAGADAAAIESFTADDAEVAAVLALPPRRRNTRIREMIRRERDGGGEGARDPADAERIAELEARVEALSQPPATHPGARWRAALDRLRESDGTLAGVAGEVAELSRLPCGVPAAQATRLLRLADGLQESLDAISGALLEQGSE